MYILLHLHLPPPHWLLANRRMMMVITIINKKNNYHQHHQVMQHWVNFINIYTNYQTSLIIKLSLQPLSSNNHDQEHFAILYIVSPWHQRIRWQVDLVLWWCSTLCKYQSLINFLFLQLKYLTDTREIFRWINHLENLLAILGVYAWFYFRTFKKPIHLQRIEDWNSKQVYNSISFCFFRNV